MNYETLCKLQQAEPRGSWHGPRTTEELDAVIEFQENNGWKNLIPGIKTIPGTPTQFSFLYDFTAGIWKFGEKKETGSFLNQYVYKGKTYEEYLDLSIELRPVGVTEWIKKR